MHYPDSSTTQNGCSDIPVGKLRQFPFAGYVARPDPTTAGSSARVEFSWGIHGDKLDHYTPFSKANALFKIYAVTKLIKLEHIYFFSMKENSLTFLLIPFIDD